MLPPVQPGRLVSICIPTRHRPGFLRQALESCLAQSYRPLEIIIGDDSEDQETERLAEAYTDRDVPVVYRRNAPPRGQAGNVDSLFRLARGDRLVLLHDDDLLLSNAVADLAACWDSNPHITAAFGTQHLISEDGRFLDDDELNTAYYRIPQLAGTKLRPVESALVQQFPNDGYMITTAAARSAGYRGVAGDRINRLSDFSFGLMVACGARAFFFLNRYTTVCRRTAGSIGSQKACRRECDGIYQLVRSVDLPTDAEWARVKALERLIPALVEAYAEDSDRKALANLYMSGHYPLRCRMTSSGLYHLGLIISPELTRYARRSLRSVRSVIERRH